MTTWTKMRDKMALLPMMPTTPAQMQARIQQEAAQAQAQAEAEAAAVAVAPATSVKFAPVADVGDVSEEAPAVEDDTSDEDD